MATPEGIQDPVGPQIAPKGRFRKFITTHVVEEPNTYKFKEIDHCKEMRILRIAPGEKTEKLLCSLEVKPMPLGKSTHLYCALSYAWGLPNEIATTKVYMADASRMLAPITYFHVRDNLAEALRSLRHEEDPVFVWVDALCINQKNAEEKTAQVARMDEIYGAAETVCIWLGAGDDRTSETFDFIPRILNLQELDRLIKDKEEPEKWESLIALLRNPWFGRRWVIQELALARRAEVRMGDKVLDWETQFSVAIDLFLYKYDDIQAILQTRPKTFQQLRNTSQFGDLDPRALGASTLVKATNNLFRKFEDGTIQQRLLPIEVLVSSMFRTQESSDPLDTIYAVLSLAKDTARGEDLLYTDTTIVDQLSRTPGNRRTWPNGRAFLQTLFGIPLSIFSRSAPEPSKKAQPQKPPLDQRLKPDYSKSPEEVYCGFIEYCIEKSNSLDILCRHWAPTRPIWRKEQLVDQEKDIKFAVPSWVLRCEDHAFGAASEVVHGRKNADSLVGEPQVVSQQYYNASAGLLPIAKIRKSDLGADTRKENQSVYSIDIKGFQLAAIVELSATVRHGIIPVEAFEMGGWDWRKKDQSTLDSVPDRLWRTLVADRGLNGNGGNAPLWYRHACFECLQYTGPHGDFNTQFFDDTPDTPQLMIEFIRRVRQVVWNRRFFLAEDAAGHSFFGLAPKGTKKEDIVAILFGCSVPVVLHRTTPGRYSFVGECYTHGIMSGEAIRDRNWGAGGKPTHPYTNFGSSFILD